MYEHWRAPQCYSSHSWTKNWLFFAGDLGQRIFQQPFSWKAAGADVRGRSTTLKINYRTSHQIRKSISYGKVVPVPATLDWDLFQGLAPRQEYNDNVQPYNWHWFKTSDTGESLNNGTHEIDVAHWALGVDYPRNVTSTAGRFQFKADWQFYDTMMTSFDYDDAMISWEGKCCNGMKYYGRDRGVAVMGTTGSVIVDCDGYEIYDLKVKKTSEYKADKTATSSTDLIGRDSMTDLHFANFIAGIQTGAKLHQPVAQGNVAVMMLQLSNVAWEVNRELHLDTTDGKVLNDPAAMKYWGRE